MSVFKRGDDWVSKFQLAGKQHWTPGGPWPTKRQAQEAERRYRDQLQARRSDETCASFSERWLEEWPRPEASTQRHYAAAARRFAEHFGPTSLGEVERLSARAWALTVPRSVSRVITTMFEDARNVGLVESNPFNNLRLPVMEKTPEITAPTMDDYKALVEATTILGGYGPEFRAMIQFAAWTGVRQGELFGLNGRTSPATRSPSPGPASSMAASASPRTGSPARSHSCRLRVSLTLCRVAPTRSSSIHRGAGPSSRAPTVGAGRR